jgi:predicted Rdx family selenoprotein
MVSLKDPGVTGNFEVSVNGNLVHSKKQNSAGFLNSDEKLNVVYKAITEANDAPVMEQPNEGSSCTIL